MSCVYFIQAGEGGPIKIGIAYNLKTRLQEIRAKQRVTATLAVFHESGLPNDEFYFDLFVRWPRYKEAIDRKRVPLTVLATTPGYALLEAKLHRFFEREHLDIMEADSLGLPYPTEWFRPSPRLLAFIDELRS